MSWFKKKRSLRISPILFADQLYQILVEEFAAPQAAPEKYHLPRAARRPAPRHGNRASMRWPGARLPKAGRGSGNAPASFLAVTPFVTRTAF
jgi:hypothetical protein